MGEAIIEVLKVKITGYTADLIYTKSEKNFHEFMSQFMDKQVEGAIGGNALRHFRITVDYPQAKAIFEKE